MGAIIKHKPDIVAFQEVAINSVNIIRKILSPSYSCIVDSFELVRKGRIIAQRRFDHFLSSEELTPKSAEYLHELRKNKLSDHSPLEVVFN